MRKLSKRELIQQSITSIFTLLTEIRNQPEAYIENNVITKALRSQSGLCNLDISFSSDGQTYSIRPLSLNTLKQKLATSNSFENFDHFNRLRLLANDSLANHRPKPSKEKKRTKLGLQDTVEKLKNSIEVLHSVNMVLLQALATNMKDLKTIKDTPNTGLRQKRIDDAMQRMTLILTLNPAPFDDVSLPISRKHLRLVSDEQ
jgi:hypothetical protein